MKKYKKITKNKITFEVLGDLGFEAVLETCEPEFDDFGDQMCFLASPNCLETCLGHCKKDFNLIGACEYRFRCSWNFVKSTNNLATVSTELTTEPVSTEPIFVKFDIVTEPTTTPATELTKG